VKNRTLLESFRDFIQKAHVTPEEVAMLIAVADQLESLPALRGMLSRAEDELGSLRKLRDALRTVGTVMGDGAAKL
jgi:hypothetical protein